MEGDRLVSEQRSLSDWQDDFQARQAGRDPAVCSPQPAWVAGGCPRKGVFAGTIHTWKADTFICRVNSLYK